MALDWTNKTDGVDYIMADDVNDLAHAIQDLEDNKEDISLKVTNISSSSTDTQYPSAKATYDFVNNTSNNLQDQIDNIEGTYAKLNQVVRYDAGQSLTDTQRQQVHDNVTRRVEQALDTPGWYRVAKMYNSSGQYTLTIRSRWSAHESTVMKIFISYSQIVNDLDNCNISSFGYVSAIDKICFVNIDNYIYIDIHYVPNNNNRVSVELEGYVLGGVISDTALIQFESQGTEAKSDMVYNLKTGMSTQGGSLYVNGTDINGRIDDIVDGTTAVSRAYKLYGTDNRDSNQPPSYYQHTDNSKVLLSELKIAANLGVESILTDSSGLCTLYTSIPWGDTSGGLPIQIAVQTDRSTGKAKMAIRGAADDSTWGAWKKVAITDDIKVTSVAGKTGAVALSKSDVGLPNVPNTDATNASNISSGSLALPRIATGLVKGGTNINVSRSADGSYTVSAEDSGAAVTSVNGKTGAVTLSKSDVGLGNVDNIKQYSASNPPPYPVTSVNGNTGAISIGTLSGCYMLNLTTGKTLSSIVNESPFDSDDTVVTILRIHPFQGRTIQYRNSSTNIYNSAKEMTFYGQMVTTTWWSYGCVYVDQQSGTNEELWNYTNGWEISSTGNVIIEEVRSKI